METLRQILLEVRTIRGAETIGRVGLAQDPDDGLECRGECSRGQGGLRKGREAMTQESMDVNEFKRALGVPVKHKPVKKAKPKKEHKLSSLEAKFLLIVQGLPQPVREYRFHPVRKWRFDFAWPTALLAVEVDGGAFSIGRHNRAIPQAGDNEKTNVAILCGWRVLKFNTVNMQDVSAVRSVVERALRERGPA